MIVMRGFIPHPAFHLRSCGASADRSATLSQRERGIREGFSSCSASQLLPIPTFPHSHIPPFPHPRIPASPRPRISSGMETG